MLSFGKKSYIMQVTSKDRWLSEYEPKLVFNEVERNRYTNLLSLSIFVLQVSEKTCLQPWNNSILIQEEEGCLSIHALLIAKVSHRTHGLQLTPQ